jgi:4-amino-4-deoxy-L-arabinose transferase-like glycosyltransferase
MNKLLSYLNKNERKVLLLMVATAFLFRFAYTLIAYLNSDSIRSEYLYWGEQFSQGKWIYPVEITSKMIVAPLMPILVSIFISLFGEPTIPVYLYNVLLTTLAIPVLYFLGKELFNERVGWSLAMWGIFFPEFFRYTPYILKEPTLFFIIPFTLLFFLRSIKDPSKIRYSVISAISFTLLIHTDERFIFYLPVLVVGWFLVRPFSILTILKPLILWIGIIIILSLPWLIRNYRVYDQLVVLSPRTTVFTSALQGNKITALDYSSYDEVIKKNKSKYSDQSSAYEKKYSISAREYGKTEIKLRALLNFWQPAYFKPVFITYGFRPQKWSIPHNISSLLFYGIFLPFYIAGLVLLIKSKHLIGLFFSVLPLIHSLLHAYMVSPLERYRSPLTFIVVMTGFWVALKLIDSLCKSGIKIKQK